LSPADFFNVLDSEGFEPMATETFGEARVEGRILHLSSDRRQLVIATRYPDGVAFDYGGAVDHEEAFYVSAGRGARKLPDGRTVPMRVGDLIFVRPGVEVGYVYEPGFSDVAFFWSDSELRRDLLGGLRSTQAGASSQEPG